MEKRLIAVAEVAAMLGRSRGWFYVHREDLAGRGFPQPIPGVRLYDADAVSSWLDEQASK
jgi:predicted DNA-binding transcriptional regulator AlpA